MTNPRRSVAVIGLGIMGRPMAVNLVKAGYDVIGYSRSEATVQALVERGGRGASTIAEAVGTADVIMTVLPDSPRCGRGSRRARRSV
jgi:2-hydroxy-3-oxopropionate reductase